MTSTIPSTSRRVLAVIVLKLVLCRDQRSLGNRAALEARYQEREEQEQQSSSKSDPTAPAIAHGNKPSRGAEVDAELQRNDELRLKEKGIDTD